MHQQCPELPKWRWPVKWDGDDNLSPLLRGSALWRQQVCIAQISCRMILVIYGCNTQPTSHSHMWYAVASLKKKKDISNPRIQKINNTFAWYNSFGLNILVVTLIALPPKNNLWNYPRAWKIKPSFGMINNTKPTKWRGRKVKEKINEWLRKSNKNRVLKS